MNVLVLPLLALAISADNNTPAAPTNTLLNELVTKGVTMPEGEVVPLPQPQMPEGLTAEQQELKLKEVAPNHDVLAFTSTLSSAPSLPKIVTLPAKNRVDMIRRLDLYFVVHGDWDMLTSDEFANNILKKEKAKNGAAGMVVAAGTVPAQYLAFHGRTARSTPNLKEYFLYTTFRLFEDEMVQVSATRYCMATQTPRGVIVAAMIDPQFAQDKVYPNEWRPMVRNELGNLVPGPVANPYPCAAANGHPPSGAGFYAKVTRLIEPADAIFIEFHSAFYEPQDWFGAGNGRRMTAELRKIIPFQVQQFRRKLLEAAEKSKNGGGAIQKGARSSRPQAEIHSIAQ